MILIPESGRLVAKSKGHLGNAGLNTNVGLAAKVLVDLATTSKSDGVRLAAASALLDRGGMALVRQSEHRHVLEDNRTDAELRAHIKQLTAELGLNATVIEHVPSKEAVTNPDDPKQQTKG